MFSDKLDFYDIVKMNITVKKDTSLDIDIKGNNEIKLDVSINVLPNVNFKMNNVTETDKIKIQYKHYLSENSNFEEFSKNSNNSDRNSEGEFANREGELREFSSETNSNEGETVEIETQNGDTVSLKTAQGRVDYKV